MYIYPKKQASLNGSLVRNRNNFKIPTILPLSSRSVDRLTLHNRRGCVSVVMGQRYLDLPSDVPLLSGHRDPLAGQIKEVLQVLDVGAVGEELATLHVTFNCFG